MRQLPIQQNRICVLQLQVRDQLLNARLDGVPVLAFETPLERRPGLLQFTTFDVLVDFHEVVLRELDPQTTLIPATSEPAAAAPPTLAQLQTAVVHVADVLVKDMACGNPGDEWVPPLSRQAWNLVGLDADSLAGCIARASEEFLAIDDYL